MKNKNFFLSVLVWFSLLYPQVYALDVSPKKDDLVKVEYTLRLDSPKGKIVESNVKDIVLSNGLTNSTSEPFTFIIWSNTVISGFEQGILSMKIGEKKMIKVLPKDGYGTFSIEKTVKKEEVAPKFTLTVDKDRFADTVTEVISKKTLALSYPDLTVGKVLTGSNNTQATVIKDDNEFVTLSITNSNNPFYGKSLVVGWVAEKDNTIYTIQSITPTKITLDVVNKNSPFYGKKFQSGVSVTLPNGQGKMRIKSIKDDVVILIMKNTHPLAGKILYFDVKLLDIQ